MTGRVMKMKPSELDSALSDTKKTIVNVKKSPWMLSHSRLYTRLVVIMLLMVYHYC